MRTVSYADPPSYICPVEGRSCHVQSTLAAEGSRVLGAKVELSVMSRNSVVLPGAEVEQSIIGEGVVIGENCRLRKVIVDSHNIIPPNTEIGFDPERDAEAYTVDPGSGIVIVGMPKMQLRKATDQPKGPFYWTNLS
jgi:glucose-1-phosphate adenylyltransferase